MRLVSKSTGAVIAEGDQIEIGKETYFVSGLAPEKDIIHLFPDREGRSPIWRSAAALGAEWRS